MEPVKQHEGLELIVGLKQMPLVALPVRTVTVPLKTGRAMISPGSMLSPEALRSTGAVTDLVAPSLLHTAGMKAAAAAHPQARLWGPPGCQEKVPELSWKTLGVDAWPHEAELSMFPVDGMPALREVAFLHRPSRTLLVSDLVFNALDARGVGAWLIFSIFGTYRRLGVSRLVLKYVKDRAAFDASIKRIAALDFDHLIPGHGHVVSGAAKAKLLEAMRARKLPV